MTPWYQSFTWPDNEICHSKKEGGKGWVWWIPGRGALCRVLPWVSRTLDLMTCCPIILYHTLPYSTILYHTLPYSTILYHTLPYPTILYHTLPHSTTLYHTLPHSTTLYHTLPYSTILYHTLPYSVIASFPSHCPPFHHCQCGKAGSDRKLGGA